MTRVAVIGNAGGAGEKRLKPLLRTSQVSFETVCLPQSF